MNTAITFEEARRIVELIAEVGRRNFDSHDVSACNVLKPILDKRKRGKGITEDEANLLANFLYLNAVLDQGRDPKGVKQMLIGVTNRAYQRGIRYLHDPDEFFKHVGDLVELIAEEHERVKMIRRPETGIQAYSLWGTRVNPYTMHRWGTVLLCLKRMADNGLTLLTYINQAGKAENVPRLIRDDETYGLGDAIGWKAARLWVKWITHTFGIVRGDPLLWGPNSYEIPLDSNVGGVTMRTGLLFLITNERDLRETQCWIKQADGRINLSAQRLNQEIAIPDNFPLDRELREVLRAWGQRRRNFIRFLNAFVLHLQRQAAEVSIGQLDDGFLHVGQNFCHNDSAPDCPRCPLRTVCKANTQEPELKTKYYCGTGQGVFF